MQEVWPFDAGTEWPPAAESGHAAATRGLEHRERKSPGETTSSEHTLTRALSVSESLKLLPTSTQVYLRVSLAQGFGASRLFLSVKQVHKCISNHISSQFYKSHITSWQGNASGRAARADERSDARRRGGGAGAPALGRNYAGTRTRRRAGAPGEAAWRSRQSLLLFSHAG